MCMQPFTEDLLCIPCEMMQAKNLLASKPNRHDIWCRSRRLQLLRCTKRSALYQRSIFGYGVRTAPRTYTQRRRSSIATGLTVREWKKFNKTFTNSGAMGILAAPQLGGCARYAKCVPIDFLIPLRLTSLSVSHLLALIDLSSPGVCVQQFHLNPNKSNMIRRFRDGIECDSRRQNNLVWSGIHSLRV